MSKALNFVFSLRIFPEIPWNSVFTSERPVPVSWE